MRYALSDGEWNVIQPIFPNKSRGVPRVDNRRALNSIFWTLRSGALWRDLPGYFGPCTTCYNRFNRWGKAGIWDDILNAVANARKASVQMLDTTIVRVHQHGACANRTTSSDVGRSRGGLTTKIHALVDGKGLPIRLALSAGQEHDSGRATNYLAFIKLASIRLWLRVNEPTSQTMRRQR